MVRASATCFLTLRRIWIIKEDIKHKDSIRLLTPHLFSFTDPQIFIFYTSERISWISQGNPILIMFEWINIQLMWFNIRQPCDFPMNKLGETCSGKHPSQYAGSFWDCSSTSNQRMRETHRLSRLRIHHPSDGMVHPVHSIPSSDV